MDHPVAYEAPQIVDLGSFAELTQAGTGKAQDHSMGAGTKQH
jgi:hypothetical protein